MTGVDPETRAALAGLPSVTAILSDPMLSEAPHRLVVGCARDMLARVRTALLSGEIEPADAPDQADVVARVAADVHAARARRMRRVVNATGVVLHTNLGRAPMPVEVARAVTEVAHGYSNVEMVLDSGERGGRLDGVAGSICALTGAEAAIAVNNNAAAVLLVLTALGHEREVVVSRGELVEIGGSFRVPDVMSAGGVRLVEVGTTNRTRAEDFAAAIGADTALLMRVHPSNFRQVGFVQRPDREALVAVARAAGVPLVEDLGSGLLGTPPVAGVGLEEERVESALGTGVDLVCFSGDKLLGGPQAGIIAGRADLVEACRKHPLYRAMRLDKLVLAALEATLKMYEEGRGDDVPARAMLMASADTMRECALRLAADIPGATVVEDMGVTGGGALPGQGLPTWVVCLPDRPAAAFSRALRLGSPAVVARVSDGVVRIDPRTLLPSEYAVVVAAVETARKAGVS